MELHKRKAVESSQTAADLKLHLDKYQAQLKEAQVAVAEKTASLEQEVFKYKRMHVRNSYLQCRVFKKTGQNFQGCHSSVDPRIKIKKLERGKEYF